MTDMKQPEALRLIAEWRNSMPIGVMRIWAADVRDELRRQHAEIESLQDDLAHKDDYAEQLGSELAKADSEAKKLRAKLEALEKQRPCGYLPYGYVGRSAMVFGQPVPESVPIYLAAGARPVEPAPDAVVGLPFAIMDNELKALRRFDECVRDPDAGGHDVRKEMMKRLAEIGLVRRVTANIYEHTNFGLSVLNGDFDAAPTTQPAPAAQDDAKDAARLYPVVIDGLLWLCTKRGGTFKPVDDCAAVNPPFSWKNALAADKKEPS